MKYSWLKFKHICVLLTLCAFNCNQKRLQSGPDPIARPKPPEFEPRTFRDSGTLRENRTVPGREIENLCMFENSSHYWARKHPWRKKWFQLIYLIDWFLKFCWKSIYFNFFHWNSPFLNIFVISSSFGDFQAFSIFKSCPNDPNLNPFDFRLYRYSGSCLIFWSDSGGVRAWLL